MRGAYSVFDIFLSQGIIVRMERVKGFEESLGTCGKCGFKVFESSKAHGIPASEGLFHDGCALDFPEEILGF